MPTLFPINFLIYRLVPEAVSPAETPQIHIKYKGFLGNCTELPGFQIELSQNIA
jgi:hypothetical protein